MYIEFVCPPMPHLIAAGTSVFRPGDIHERRSNTGTFDLIVINKGTLYIQEEEEQYTLIPGDYLILGPDHLHRGFRPCMEEVTFNWLHFSTVGEFCYRASVSQQKPRRMSHKQYYKRESFSVFLPQSGHLDAASQQSLLHTMNSLVEVKINHNYREKRFLPATVGVLESQQLFLNVLSVLHEQSHDTSANSLAAQIYAHIASHSKQPFSLDYLSEKFSYHKVYIIKVVKDSYSVTPAHLHTQFRMEDARALLENTAHGIQDIAKEVGYEDAAYFSKQFKKYTGMSPREYRQNKS